MWTLIIALYGAVLSTISILVLIYEAVHERPRIKLTANPAFIQSSEGVSGPFISINVANRGRRPVTIVSVGFRIKPKGLSISFIPLPNISAPLPKEIGENEAASYYTGYKDLIETLTKHKTEIKGIWARSATGKTYKKKWVFQRNKGGF